MCAELFSERYTFRKTFRRVAPIVKAPKNERITFAWRIFYFLPIQKIRLQEKVRRFWTEINCICWRSVRLSIGKPMEHQPSFTITADVLLKYTDLKSMRFAVSSKISNFFLKTNFLDRSKAKNPSCERDTFIFRVFYDRSNSGKSFSKKCMSCKFALHTSTNF